MPLSVILIELVYARARDTNPVFAFPPVSLNGFKNQLKIHRLK